MKCCGCGRHVSEWSDYLMPEPDQFWHPQCWGYIFWHVQDGGGNPRPMTPEEKADYIAANKVCAAIADGQNAIGEK